MRRDKEKEREKSSLREIANSSLVSSHSSRNAALDLQRKTGNQAVLELLHSGAIQAKLRVSQPGDADELEADSMAEQVVSGEAGSASQGVGISQSEKTAAAAGVQRKCSCEGGATCPECEEDKTKGIHRKPFSSATDVLSAPDDLLQKLGPGRALDPGVRKSMESQFGHDFSGVRVHDDSRAAESARSVNARAFTLGHNVVFDSGEYAPHTTRGKRLLSHELAHVVQQRNSGDNSTTIKRDAKPDQPASQEHSSHAATSLADIPAEKWSEQIEGQYRIRGDTMRADAIRACRTQGRSACAKILTASETMRLHALAQESKGDETKIKAGMASAAPLLAEEAAKVASRAAPGLRLVPPPAGPAAAAGLSLETIAAVGGVAAIIAICVISAIELWKLAQFQDELRKKGFIIIDDPLPLCIGGCHLPAAPRTGAGPDFKIPPQLSSPSEKDREFIQKWLEQTNPKTRPAPKEKEDPQKKCQETNKHAFPCGPEIDRDQAVMEFLLDRDIEFIDVIDFKWEKMSSFEPGEIRDCSYSSGESWHCTVKLKNAPSRIVSIFKCLCCAKDGSTRFEWRVSHFSPGK